MTGDRRPTVSIADDDRARIPFALIGVLLLVSSVTMVGVLESRPDPRPDVDPSLAMDRTAATTQTTLRNAVVSAADDAASDPVTDANAADPWGRAIDGPTADAVFERSLRLRIYRELEAGLTHAGQTIRDDTVARVSVPPLENGQQSAADAIDRVRIERGGDGSLEPGLLEVTVEDVTITVERDGDRVAERTQDVTVTVATTLFELRQKTQEYERQLNTGFFEADGYDGFGRYFAARTYPLSWARGYAQYGGAPVTEVIANRHVEVLANDAVFTTQRAVFGTTDPYEQRTMMNAWGCLAAKDAEEVYEGTYDEEPAVVNAEELCTGLDYVYGDVEGELPPPPETSDLLAATPGMDATETISVNEVADVAFAEVLAEGEIDDVIDDLHEIEASTDVSHVVDDHDEPDVTPPPETATDPDNWTDPSTIEDTTTTSTASVDHVAHDPDTSRRETDYHTFHVTVVNEHFERKEWRYEGNRSQTGLPATVTANDTSTSEFEIEIALSGAHPDADVDYNGIETDYDPGGWPAPLSDNYDGVPDAALERLLGLDSDRSLESQLEAQLTDTEAIESAAALEREFRITDSAAIDADPSTELLTVEIAHDLATLRDEAAGVSYEFERHEIIQGEPFEKLKAEVDDERRYVYEGDPNGAYDSVADKARVEVRQVYLETLLSHIDDVADTHADTQDALEEELDDEVDATDDALADVTTFAQDALAGNVTEHEGELEGSPLLENVTFTPAGSPTYLSLETVERDQVPAVGDGEHAPMAAKNYNWFAVPYNEKSADWLAKVLDYFDDSNETEEVITLRTAGEMLQAAELAAEVKEDDDFLSFRRAQLKSEIENELNAIAGKTAERAANTDHLSGKEDHIEKTLKNEVFPSLGNVGQQAIKLGGQEGAKQVRSIVKQELEIPDDTPYDNTEIWREHASSVIVYELSNSLDEGVIDSVDRDDLNQINERVRDELDQVTRDVIEYRVQNDSVNATKLEEEWLTNKDNETRNLSPSRIPAGMPIMPIPGSWYVTANVWDIEVEGEYARFELQASSGTPVTVGGTTYIRDGEPVQLKGDDTTHTIGHAEPISFSSRTMVLIVVPPGRIGVGDRTGERTECSATWPNAGDVNQDSQEADC